jgi:hypothetical protein
MHNDSSVGEKVLFQECSVRFAECLWGVSSHLYNGLFPFLYILAGGARPQVTPPSQRVLTTPLCLAPYRSLKGAGPG